MSAEDGQNLVGYTYGFTMEAGRWWRGALTLPPDEVLKETKLAVIELMVRDDHRGSGMGTHLLAKLLSDRDERYATLTARPRRRRSRDVRALGVAGLSASRNPRRTRQPWTSC